MADLIFHASYIDALKTWKIPTVVILSLSEVIIHAYTQPFLKNGDIQYYDIRRANDFSFPPHHSSFFDKKSSCAGAKLFNVLPKDLKTYKPRDLKN